MIFTIMDRGGAETMVMNYFRNVDRSTVVFDFLVHREEEGAYDNEIKTLGGNIFKLPGISLKSLSAYKQAVHRFFEEHNDYRIIHGHCSELGYWIYKEASKKGVPFIAAHAHNAPLGWDLKMPFRNVLKRLMRPYITHCFTCAEASAIWLFGKERAKNAIFQANAVDASKFQYAENKRNKIRTREQWDKRFIIGNVSRFDKQKNHLFLLDIVSEILKKRQDILCVLIGANGSEYEKVKQRIKDLNLGNHIKLYGTRSDIPELMQGMDVLLFPSFHEGLSVTMIEAQSSGLKTYTSTGVSKQVAIIPKLVDFIELNRGAKYWASQILQQKYERKNTFESIKVAHFDIKENAKWLTEFYLSQIKNK
ncbi:glycosyltransferase [Saccharicrinis aurantiacus]|uniref:glycosyltransferase n=1 Tax=Saccharicrinis aurantiacus TaxID=1849719 RepID=UPI0024917620|nr:glycosyltransferase [Saccharicrinis aurantiacus]